MAMLIPTSHNNFFDDFLMSPFDSFFGDDGKGASSEAALLRTDVKEDKNQYTLVVDIPGVDKQDVNVSLKNGYLQIGAKAHHEVSEGGKDEKFLRKERFEGEASRSFYVGNAVHPEDINAKFGNGTLTIVVPKKTQQNDDGSQAIAID